MRIVAVHTRENLMARSARFWVSAARVLVCLLVSEAASAGVNQWTSLGPEGGSIVQLLVDPSNPATLYAGTGAGVFKSRDGGASWNRESGSPAVGALAQSASSPNVLYGLAGSSMSKTTDGGTNWSSAGFIPVGSFITIEITGLVVDPTDSSVLWAGVNNVHVFGNGIIWKSTDGGSSWQSVNASFPGFGVGIIAIDPRSPHAVFAEAMGLQKTLDGGTTWTATSGLTDAVSELAFPPGAPALVVAGTYRCRSLPEPRRRDDVGAGQSWFDRRCLEGVVSGRRSRPRLTRISARRHRGRPLSE